MDRQKANAILQSLYKKDNPGGEMAVVYGGFNGTKFEGGATWYTPATEVDVNLSKPELTFLDGQHEKVKITQSVKSGKTRTGTLIVEANTKVSELDYETEKSKITWSSKGWETLEIGTGAKAPRVECTVPLGVLKGAAKPHDSTAQTLAVTLTLASGDFQAKYVHGENLNALDERLKGAFTKKGIVYQINTVDCSKISPLAELKPSQFSARTKITNENKDILQLFITTNGTPRADKSVLVNEPLPDSHDCSLMINTRIMFQAILARGFNGAASGLSAEAVDPDSLSKTWTTKVNGSVSAEINWPNLGYSSTSGWVSYGFWFSEDNKKTVTLPLDGMLFSPATRAPSRSDTASRVTKLTSSGGAVSTASATSGRHPPP